MAFSFGAPAAPKPAASTFSFGAPAASTSTSTPSLFGSTPAAPTTSAPSLFGSTPATSAPGGGGTTSLFGGGTSTAAPSGGLFGSTPAASGGSLFGGAQQQKPATTSLFGGGGGGTSQPGTTPSLFGTSQPTSTPSLFGTSQAQPTTSLFGQPQQQQQQQQTGSSLFGGGQQPQQQPAVTSAPLFGQSQSAATASLFGSKPASTQPTTTSLSLFGNNNNNNASGNQFQQSQSQQQQQQQQQSQPLNQSIRKLGEPPLPNPLEPTIESRIESIKSAYDPQHSKCRFQTYFYNEPAVGQNVQNYARPPNGTDDKAWNKAIKENPDPDHLVPAIAIGFSSLQKRIESQQRQTQSHQSLLSEIHSHLSQLSSTHSLTTSLRVLRAQQTSLHLLSRLTLLISKSSSLSPSRNQSLKKDEENLRILLESFKNQVEFLKTKSQELWTGVGMMRSRKKEMDQLMGVGGSGGQGGQGGGGGGWAVVDEQGFNQILEVLTSQQRGLDHLTKTLEQMSIDVDVMNEAFGLQKLHKNGSVGVGGGGSTTTNGGDLSGSVVSRR
ncbi:hypothetical protein JCM3765_006611 [Sporobolomyces pararoseus]